MQYAGSDHYVAMRHYAAMFYDENWRIIKSECLDYPRLAFVYSECSPQSATPPFSHVSHSPSIPAKTFGYSQICRSKLFFLFMRMYPISPIT